MRINRSKGQLLLIFITVGFLIGIIYQNVVSGHQIITTDLFLQSNLERYLHTDVVAEKYLWYVLKERVLLLGVVLILGFLKWKKFVVAVCLGWVGFVMGVLTVSSVLQLGIKGILFCIAGLLPQGIFYGIFCSVLFVYWYWFPIRQWNKVKTIFLVLMFSVGVLVEAYVNPLLVKWVIQIIC